jgi:GNAT superfamily N-acetyltransferase
LTHILKATMAIDFEVTPGVVEAIERATLQAVRPDVVDTSIPGWLLPMDGGTVGRAHSAVPLAHPQDASAQAAQAMHLPHIAQRYRANGLPPVFRLPDDATWLHDAARALGAERVEPTWVMTVPMSKLLQLRPLAYAGNVHISVERLPDPAWQALFTGEGLDPVDGAHRVRLLSRAEQTLFVSASLEGETVACGAASFGHGWMGVHGMRTAAAHRGHGHAGRVLQAMAAYARCGVWAPDSAHVPPTSASVQHAFLQVGATNQAALAVYRRAGFAPAWRYAYWRCA